jgi:phosphate/sulfate permease
LIILVLPVELMLLLFAFGGIGLKIADYSGEHASRTLSLLSASVTALIFGLLLSHSPVSSSIVLGIILGVLFSGKIDQINLIIGLVLTVLIAFLLNFQVPLLGLLFAISVFSFIDELIHDRYSSKKHLLAKILGLRPFLKLTFLLLGSLSMIEVNYLVAFFCFDLSYDVTGVLLEKYALKQK